MELKLFIVDLGTFLFAIFDWTTFEQTLIKKLFEDSIQRSRCYYFLTHRAAIVTFQLPLIDAMFAEQLVACGALLWLYQQHQTYVASKVFRNLTFRVDSFGQLLVYCGLRQYKFRDIISFCFYLFV